MECLRALLIFLKSEWQYQIDIGNGFFHSNKAFTDFMDEMGIQIVQNCVPEGIKTQHILPI